MEALGDRIKLIRGSRSQEDFAKLIGVDRTTLASWEIDRREPGLDTLSKIADLAAVSLDWLIGRDSSQTIEQGRAHHDSQWHEIIDLAITHDIKPEKVKQLIKAALTLKA